jgi:ATP-binding cassette subfamily B protein
MRDLTWPAAQLDAGITALAKASGLTGDKAGQTAENYISIPKEEGLNDWMEAAAGRLGLETEAAEFSAALLERQLPVAGPAILRMLHQGELRFLLLLEGSKGRLRVLTPGSGVKETPAREICRPLCASIEKPHQAVAERLLQVSGVKERHRSRAAEAIVRERTRGERIGGCWLLRATPGADLASQARRARLPHRLLALAFTHAGQYVLWILSWWMIGKGALEGRLDQGWLSAWALLLLTMIPLHLLTLWLQGRVAIAAGGLLKSRLLYGGLRLNPDEIRLQGAGQLLGCVIEAELVESLALGGGFLALVAVLELIMAAAVLAAGAAGVWHALLLAGWLLVTLLAAWLYLRRRERWTQQRLEMTHDLVERMNGHRTRLAQEPRDRWHETEDEAIDHYAILSKEMDGAAAGLLAAPPRGWMLAGLAALAPSFIAGTASPAALAVGLGGILLAYRALKQLAEGSAQLAGAWIAWRRVAPLSRAAESNQSATHSFPRTEAEGPSLVEAHDLNYRYPGRAEPVLRGCSVKIAKGERLLLEGGSGSGKSTFASLLTGLRAPDSGLLLLGGLDRHTIGENAWRRSVAAAPQFHENHVLAGTFWFNLTLGAPDAAGQDFAEAETICRELGLGELLDRMPAGLLQMVGETGWQLSHGEKSRLFIARTLLQGASLVVLDESFAALDPENLRQAMDCVKKRAGALLVIAHP